MAVKNYVTSGSTLDNREEENKSLNPTGVTVGIEIGYFKLTLVGLDTNWLLISLKS